MLDVRTDLPPAQKKRASKMQTIALLCKLRSSSKPATPLLTLSTMTSASAQEALSHLKKIKPLGGWSLESKNGVVRLLRRSVPLTDCSFLDIHHDSASDCVVGILAQPKSGRASAQVLVDQDGKPTGTEVQVVTVSSYDPNKRTSTASSGRTTERPAATSSATNNTNTLSDEENKKLLQYAMYIVGGSIIFSIVSQAVFTLSLLLVPCLYFYALQTCPSEASFDAKKELRRILRGHHLPENHPDKPKNFFDKTIARVSAAVTTELATGLGYEVSMMVSSF
jgi:hypothetical protein